MVKSLPANAGDSRDSGLILGSGRSPEVGSTQQWQPAPVFSPGEFLGQRRLADCSPWGHKESDTTEQLSTAHIHTDTKDTEGTNKREKKICLGTATLKEGLRRNMNCLNCEEVSNSDQSPEECHEGERPKQIEVSPLGTIKIQHPKKTWPEKAADGKTLGDHGTSH